jgi:hypothetical protein
LKIKSASKLFKGEIKNHLILIMIFSSVILFTYLDVNHLSKNNCLLLEPSVDCTAYGTISRQAIIANQSQYVYISHNVSIYHLDEFRQLHGFMHVNCPVNNNTCTYHYDVYNGVTGFGLASIFNSIGHGAETLDRICWYKFEDVGFTPDIYGCNGIPDSYSVLIIWAGIIFLPYYSYKIAKHFLK